MIGVRSGSGIPVLIAVHPRRLRSHRPGRPTGPATPIENPWHSTPAAWVAGWSSRPARARFTGGDNNTAYVAIAPANWPALFDDDTWRHLQAVLDAPQRQSTNSLSRTVHLLTGVAVCGIHDAPVRVVKNRGYPAYGCSAAWDTVRRESHLDAYVSEAVIAWAEKAKAAGLDVIAPAIERGVEMDALQKELADITQQLDDLYSQARSRAISVQAVASIEPGLLTDQERLNRRIRTLTLPHTVRSFVDHNDIREAWQDMPLPHRRATIRAIVVPAILPVGKGTRKFKPDAVDLRWLWPLAGAPTTTDDATGNGAPPANMQG